MRPPAARAAAFAAAALLAACAAVTPLQRGAGIETLSGRLAVNVAATPQSAARALSAAFELQGDEHAGRLNLSTPLGSMLAQARWSPGEVVLKTPQGEHRFGDLDALSREMLGEELPLAALIDWLHGRPWAGAASVARTQPPGFEQLGWVVDLARYDEAAAVAATRIRPPPAVTLRARLDRPD